MAEALAPEDGRVRHRRGREVLDRLLDADAVDWPALRADLPAPLTAAEQAEALRQDGEREELGAFDTWQLA